MGTVTVRESMRKVSTLLQDDDPQFTRHKEAELVDWFNDACRALFTYLPIACSRIDTWKLKPGSVHSIDSIAAADLKPGDGSTPTDPLLGSFFIKLLNNMGTDGVSVGRAIRPLTDGHEVLDTLSPNWHAQADATEVLNFIFDPTTPRQFMTYPPVPPGRLWVRGAMVSQTQHIPNVGEAGYATYAASGSNAYVLPVADEYEQLIVHYVCGRALLKDSEGSASVGASAADYVQLFTGGVNAISQAVLGVNPNLKRLPFAPEPAGAAS